MPGARPHGSIVAKAEGLLDPLGVARQHPLVLIEQEPMGTASEPEASVNLSRQSATGASSPCRTSTVRPGRVTRPLGRPV